ncbi:MAG: mechanosensitive ion channel family protein [Nitrosomonadales bacterium]|nr:mechanosensitive ion channel family protein [Nitrosomonadales bacterium]
MTINLSPENLRLLAVLAAAIAAHYLARRALQQAAKVAAHTDNIWDDSLIEAARKPLPVLIWLTGISFALHLLHRQTGEELLEYVAPLRSIGIVLCVSWFLLKLIREVGKNVTASHAQAGQEIDRTMVDSLGKVSRIAVVVIAALAVMQTLGFSLSGLLAFGGMGGIAVGFAAKDLLSNLFGGLMIQLDRPFAINDFIRVSEQQLGGTVEYIGWRHTRLRSIDKTALYIPNSIFTTVVVENVTRMSHRRFDLTISLRYQDMDKVEAVSAAIRKLLENHPGIDHDLIVAVGLEEFAASSLDLKVMAFTQVTDFQQFRQLKQDLLLQISAILGNNGADIPFQTQTLHIVREDA